MRDVTTSDIDQGFALLATALRYPRSDDLEDAIRHAAEMLAERDPEIDEDELAEAISEARWDRYASVNTLSLSWDQARIGGASFLQVLVVMDDSVWITQSDTAAETEYHWGEYESVAAAEEAAAPMSLELLGEFGLPSRISTGPFSRDEVRAYLLERLEESDSDPLNWSAVEEAAKLGLGEAAIGSLADRELLLDRYLDLAIDS